MKIAYYTDQTYLHGGIERVLANKVNYWTDKKDIETHIISSEQKNNPPCYRMNNEVIFHDLQINYNRKLSYLHPINLKKVLRHYFKLKKLIKKIQPDVLVVCNFSFDFYFIPFLSKKTLKIKEFHSSRHFDDINRKKNKNILKKIYYRLNDYIESKYDFLALLTEDEKNYYKSKNTVVVPNALTAYPSNCSKLIQKKVISAGRIAPVKGFERLIEAWKIVSNKHPDWVLEIYGDGETDYIDTLQNLIESFDLKNQIILCGAVNNINEKMLSSSIYALSSTTECFPMVLLEALSFGLPVISFDCPNGPRNIVTNNQDGILVENNNIDAFAIAIIKLIENEELRFSMGKQARENIKRLLPDVVMENWLKIFNRKHN